jgi:hypothetical protein
MPTECSPQLTFWKVGKQQVAVDFKGGEIVTDAGLLAVRQFERELGILAGLADGWLDPRDRAAVTYDAEQVLTQLVYQILAGYSDANDANALRHDALFKSLLDLSPNDDDETLASGSTLARFQYGYTRRQKDVPIQDRQVLVEQQQARTGRIRRINDYLIDLFIRTRTTPPAYIVLDIDPTDDPTHGQQVLSFYHGYYGQHQYFPLLIFDGESGFPLAAWLRPGTVHASCGAVESLDAIVQKLRRAWPDVTIVLRGDSGLAVPELYEYCEENSLFYALGYATNEVLKRRTDQLLKTVELAVRVWGEDQQTFRAFDDYQAGSWSRPRRIVAKIEANSIGVNRRFVVTNLSGDPQGLYRGFYVQRGDVPEKRIGELKNHLHADRLSAHGFMANGLRLGLHVVAFAIVVLLREACVVEAPEVARAEVGTIRERLFKAGARVRTSARRIWFHFSASWPSATLFRRVVAALAEHVRNIRAACRSGPRTAALLLK